MPSPSSGQRLMSQNSQERSILNESGIPTLGSEESYVNFKLWKTGIELALEAEEQWDTKKGAPSVKKEDEKRMLFFINRHISAQLRTELSDHASCSGLIAEIGAKFENCKVQEGKTARRELYSLKKGQTKMIDLFQKVESLSKIVVTCLNQKCETEEKIDILLASLPDEYAQEKREIKRNPVNFLWEIKPQLIGAEKLIEKSLQKTKPFLTPTSSNTYNSERKKGYFNSEQKPKLCKFHPSSKSHNTEECGLH